MAALCFVSYVAGKSSPSSEANGVAADKPSNSNAAMRRLCSSDGGGEAKSLLLPGGSAEQRAEVDSWLDFAASFSSEHLGNVDRHLNGRSFLAGSSFSLADIVLYFASAPIMAAADASSARKTLNFSRWFNQVQHRVRLMAPSCDAVPAVVPLDIFVPVSIPLPPKRTSTSSATPASSPPTVDTGSGARADTSASSRGVPDGDDKADSGGGRDGSSKKKDKKGKKMQSSEGDAAAATAAAPAGKGKGGDAGKGKEKGKGDAGSAEAKPEPAAAEGDPSKLDVRVGVIVKAWEHPDSDKLFCEEIDLGEGKTRNIASGLRAFYSLEEMQGRRVIVLANLKARNIGGFKSEGMVLCASSADHSVVKLIEPPTGAAIGARATISGTEGEPATPPQMQKKKILEKCAPKLRTNGEGLAGYDGVGVFNVDGKPCVPTMPGAFVS